MLTRESQLSLSSSSLQMAHFCYRKNIVLTCKTLDNFPAHAEAC